MNGTDEVVEAQPGVARRPSKPELLLSDEEMAARVRQGSGYWPTVGTALAGAAMGCMLFGAALGSYGQSGLQILASAIKVPLLLLGTTLLCFPTFYLLQSVRGSKPLSLGRAAVAQALALLATGVVWGGFAPPLLFLVVSTAQYRLAQLLALVIGAAGGAAGLLRLRRTLGMACEADGVRLCRDVMSVYVVLFSVVGGQLAWVLRPFIGDPGQPFEWTRHLGGSMLGHIVGLLGG